MSTHTAQCIVCGVETACCNDEHALGVGRGCYDAGDWPGQPKIEFCSLACFDKLTAEMAKRREIYLTVSSPDYMTGGDPW